MLLVISVLLSLMSLSQDYGRVVRATKLNYINSQWVEQETIQPNDFFIIIKDYEVTVGTKKFMTYGDVETTNYEGFVCYTWKCIDPDGNKCSFMMKKFSYSTQMIYMFVYPQSSSAYEYLIQK